jgi:C4-dicarboxylate transporter DctM subunit
VICNAGTLGILIPPSIVMVVYAAVTETSVGPLFMAGVVPGPAGPDADGGRLVARRQAQAPAPAARPAGPKCWRTFRESTWGLLLLVIIMGGIYGGVFTPTEAAAVSAVYAVFVAVFVYRDIGSRTAARASGCLARPR